MSRCVTRRRTHDPKRWTRRQADRPVLEEGRSKTLLPSVNFQCDRVEQLYPMSIGRRQTTNLPYRNCNPPPRILRARHRSDTRIRPSPLLNFSLRRISCLIDAANRQFMAAETVAIEPSLRSRTFPLLRLVCRCPRHQRPRPKHLRCAQVSRPSKDTDLARLLPLRVLERSRGSLHLPQTIRPFLRPVAWI